MTDFVADFEAYMPDEFNGEPYGRAGLFATANEAGIDTCVVFPGILPPDPRSVNRALLQELTGEERILPGCLVNPTMGAAAVDEVRRCAGEGARSVKLMAAAHGYRLDSTCVDAVMETAGELELPVTIHSGSPVSGCSPDYIGTLAGRHPTVTIIMDHMGYREWMDQAAMAAAANPNIHLGTTLIAAAEPIWIKKMVLGHHIAFVHVHPGRLVFVFQGQIPFVAGFLKPSHHLYKIDLAIRPARLKLPVRSLTQVKMTRVWHQGMHIRYSVPLGDEMGVIQSDFEVWMAL